MAGSDDDRLAADGRLVTVRRARAGDRAQASRVFGAAAGGLAEVVALDGAAVIGVGGRRAGVPSAPATIRVRPAHRGRGIGTLLAERMSGAGTPSRVEPDSGVRALLAPRSVAVAGAERRRGGVGHEVLRGLRDYGFRGALHAVNRSGRPVCGIPGVRRLRDLPEAPDLLLIATPPEALAGLVAEAGEVGVRAAVLLGAPRVRDGSSAAPHWPRLVREAGRHGVRLIGPDSLGVLRTAPRVRLDAGLAAARPAPGALSVLVQSGAAGIALLDEAVRGDCGVAGFVSLGDGDGGVAVEELLAYWFDDPVTRAVAVHLESYRGAGRLGAAVRALGRRKPVLAVGSGLPRPASDAPRVPRFAEEMLLRQAGVVQAADAGELMDAARMLTTRPLPTGDRLAIVGNAGSLATAAAGAARRQGFRVVPLSPTIRGELPSVDGSGGGDNPVDLGMGAAPGLIAEAAETVAASGDADILLLLIAGTRVDVPAGILTALGRVADDHPGLAVAAVLVGAGDDERPSLGARGAPVFRTPQQAVRALAHARRYALWCGRPLGRRPAPTGVDPGGTRTLIEEALTRGDGWLPRGRAAEILAGYGIRVASGPEPSAPVAATLTGRPPSGGDTGAEVAVLGRTTRTVAPRPAPAPAGLSAAMFRDPLFGPVIRLSRRGAPVDDAAGHVFRLLPLTDRDATDMRRALPGVPALADPGTAAATDDLLGRLSRLAQDQPEVVEAALDLVADAGGLAADRVKLRLGAPR